MKKTTHSNLLLSLIIPIVSLSLLLLWVKTRNQNLQKPSNTYKELIFEHNLSCQEHPDLYEPEWNFHTITQGENFSIIASQHLSLTPYEILQVTDQAKEIANLAQLQTGQTIQYRLNSEGALQELKIPVKYNIELLIIRQESTFMGQVIQKTLTKTHSIYKGIISQTLSSSMQAQDVPCSLASKASILLEKRNNLRDDLRQGDKFDLLITSDEVDGELFSPQIEAIRLDGYRIKTALYIHSDGYYYDKNGYGLDPSFYRYPLLSAYKISSHFNLSREHPITGQTCPHYGTDFATPIGTPVISPAEGKVISSGYQQCTGNYLTIKHYNGYITRYFHLSELFVTTGDKVSLSAKIALTGNSGRSTGAHLHYELQINNRPVDTMLVNLPLSKNLKGEELTAFQEQVLQRVAMLGGSYTHLAISETQEKIPKS
ncbi:MAG: peptidoglycan DD-metalloendopeptidase family protein [Candidatus Endonucleobacter bathymodioli]|uniref:Peptidoglycan DD-metalloendopeptidase family protein n=1 Tax=Candidatus Endonucleibacter bathymodioli TaxID=539814 RepID=A0AA90NWT4_9GAMM|nr:peptidoglycan DD-metalloendopeptidase family protein [Candidatus Endonucleobacter bathymodioli]